MQKIENDYKYKKEIVLRGIQGENRRDQEDIAAVSLKIEDAEIKNLELLKEIERLELEHDQKEQKQKESYFLGQYIWVLQILEK